MADLIDRQAAIDAIENAFDRETILNRFVRKIAISVVRLLPSAQLEQRWIPCSERLPEENEYVLLCNRELEPDEEAGYSRMAVGWLEDGKFCCWDDRAARKEFVAWMPLPEAYREEK